MVSTNSFSGNGSNSLVMSPCGSRSTTRTFFPASAQARAVQAARVVLPVPLRRLAKQMVSFLFIVLGFACGVSVRDE